MGKVSLPAIDGALTGGHTCLQGLSLCASAMAGHVLIKLMNTVFPELSSPLLPVLGPQGDTIPHGSGGGAILCKINQAGSGGLTKYFCIHYHFPDASGKVMSQSQPTREGPAHERRELHCRETDTPVAVPGGTQKGLLGSLATWPPSLALDTTDGPLPHGWANCRLGPWARTALLCSSHPSPWASPLGL